MEYATVTWKPVAPKVELPIFRNRKDWRRYQVMLKRMSARIDADIMATVLGQGPFDPPPESYPTKPRKARSFLFDPANMTP